MLTRRLSTGTLLMGVLFLAAACGRPAPAPAPTPTPTPTPTPPPAPAAGVPSCEAFRFLGFPGMALPLPGFLAGMAPGADVAGGEAPTSPEGREADRLFASVLRAVAGEVRGGCFVEVRVDEGWGMWSVYALPQEPDLQALRAALEGQEGVEEVEGATFATPIGQFGFLGFEFRLGERRADGMLLLPGGGQVIAVAGVPEEEVAEAPPEETPTPVARPPAGPAPTPTPTPVPTPVPTSALPEPVARVDALFRPLLEEATGWTLSPTDYVFQEQGPMTLTLITYTRLTGGEPPEEFFKALADALKEQGAQDVIVQASPTELLIGFQGLPLDGGQATGTVTLGDAVEVSVQWISP